MSKSTKVKVPTIEQIVEQLSESLLALEDTDNAANQLITQRRDSKNDERSLDCVPAMLRERQLHRVLVERFAALELLISDGLEYLGYWLPGQPRDEQKELAAIISACTLQIKKAIRTAATINPASGKKSLTEIGYSYLDETLELRNPG